MNIKKVTIYKVDIPLKEPFIISYASFDMMPAIIIRMETDDGLVGYGESVPDEHVTGESVHSVFAALKHNLIPAVKGLDPRNLGRIHDMMNQQLVGNGAAKAAVDIACYDILGKYSQLPIYTLLGGRKEAQPVIPKVLSILEPEVLAEQAEAAVAEGYRDIKMKLSPDYKKDIKRVRAVREAVGNEVTIRVDVNQGWQNVQHAEAAMQQLAPLHVSWVEQPIAQENVSMFQVLHERTSIPLMADESLIMSQDLRTLAEHRSIDYINIKLMKSGGIFPSHKLATQAELFGIHCQIGSMVESSIGSAAGFHVSLSKQNIVSTELSGPTKFTTDVGDLSYSLPYVNITDQPGLGITVDPSIVEELSSKKAEL